ncbi:MAG: hypothetical protein ACKVVT_02570 [Dehalococcoidia bacterium]
MRRVLIFSYLFLGLAATAALADARAPGGPAHDSRLRDSLSSPEFVVTMKDFEIARTAPQR